MPESQDRAEALDDDKLGGEYPPERPLGVEDAPDDRAVDSLEDRTRRLVPDDERPVSEVDELVDGGERPSPQDDERVVPLPAEDAALHEEER